MWVVQTFLVPLVVSAYFFGPRGDCRLFKQKFGDYALLCHLGEAKPDRLVRFKKDFLNRVSLLQEKSLLREF